MLGALVLLFYAATIVRLGPNALRKGQVSPTSPVVQEPKDAAPGAKAPEAK